MSLPYSGLAFLGCSLMGGKQTPPPKICQTYPTSIKLGTVIPYLEKILKVDESRVAPLNSTDISILSLKINKFCYIKKCRYRLHFSI